MQQNYQNHTVKRNSVVGRFVFISFVIILLASACRQNDTPEGVLNQPKMVNIMTDLHMIDGYVSTLMYNDTIKVDKQNLYSSVYKKHKVSKAVYEKSLKYYSLQPELLDTIYVQVEKKLTLKENRLNKIQQLEEKKLPSVQ